MCGFSLAGELIHFWRLPVCLVALFFCVSLHFGFPYLLGSPFVAFPICWVPLLLLVSEGPAIFAGFRLTYPVQFDTWMCLTVLDPRQRILVFLGVLPTCF